MHHRHILVTGASGHLGAAVLEYCAAKDWKIVAAAGRSGLDAALQPLVVHHQSVDLTKEDQTAEFVASAWEAHGPLRGAVLLAGGFAMAALADTTEEDLRKMYDLNFRTAWNVVKHLLPRFEEAGGGRFIFIGARPALEPAKGTGAVAYSLSKSLLVQLARLIHASSHEKGVTAHVIAPGIIDTEANRQAMPDADFSSWTPPKAIAATIDYLLSDHGAAFSQTVLPLYNDAHWKH